MNTSFERCKDSTDEWYTPPEIINALGEFDLDPCSPMHRPFDTAKRHINKEQDGLKEDWGGARVWLNPPYSRPLVEMFVRKMVENGNGIALLFNRCDTAMFHNLIFPNAHAILFMRGRIKFYRADGRQAATAGGCGSVLIAFGEDNARMLKESRIEGKYIQLK